MAQNRVPDLTEGAIMRFAEVAVDAPAGHNRTFSYSIPPFLDVRPGQLVSVPFGPRKLQGVIFSLARRPQVEETRDILSVGDGVPVLSDHQLRLATWISTYYMSTLFEAAALMFPPGGRIRLRTFFAPSPDSPGAGGNPLSPYQQKVYEFIRRRSRVEESRLVSFLGERAGAAARRLEERGLVTRSYARATRAAGPKLRAYVKLATPASATSAGELETLARRAPRQSALICRLIDAGAPLLASEARKEYGPSAVDALLRKGLLETQRVAVERDPLEGLDLPVTRPVTLTRSQEKAASDIARALVMPVGPPRHFLIEGVTGSGKTEIYLEAVNRCLELGKKAIVMVPEIALTHQTVERFASRFPGNVAVLHSGLTAGERFDQWWKVRRGEYGVVIGSRSGIFAPVRDLGLIVIDEEHEWTYKQHDASPRYHARDVALRLAELTSSVVVLGSATPDVGSYYMALQGRFRLLRLPTRVVGGGPPASGKVTSSGLAPVRIVDMREELRDGNRSFFSRPLVEAMRQCVETGAQGVLFLNRRGSASSLQCRSCGHSLRCRRCDIAMTFHKDNERLICHYCGLRRIPPTRCPECRRHTMSYYGIGTQAVVDEVSRQFPGAAVIRWDRDAAKTPQDHQALLNRFRTGQARFLVGTQMVAKGLHFPSVTLVGVVSADVGLNVPDFRAGERAFQLLCQVAGRAGRGDSPGTVIIQTFLPDSYAIRAAATQDYPRFYRQEMVRRKEQGSPPLTRLLRLLYSHTNRALCEREALRLSDLLRLERDAWGYTDTEVLGPTPAYPARLRGHHRWQLHLRGPSPRTLLDKVKFPHGWVVDVDPVGLG